jgi:hypothetical protein
MKGVNEKAPLAFTTKAFITTKKIHPTAKQRPSGR